MVIVLVSCSRDEAITPKLSDGKYYCLGSATQCEHVTPFGQLSILFSTKEISEEVPFKILLKGLNDDPALLVSSYIEGAEMFMGKIPVFFEQNEAKERVAETMMVGCTEDEMKWRLWIEITDTQTNEKARFFKDFSVFR